MTTQIHDHYTQANSDRPQQLGCTREPILRDKSKAHAYIVSDGLFKTAPKPKSRCGMGAHMQDRHNPLHHRVAVLLCGCWSCARCKPKLQDKWIAHINTVSGKLHLSVLPVDPKAWASWRAQARRCGVNYIRIEVGEDEYAVLHSGPMAGSVPIPERMRESIIVSAVMAIGDKPRPISTSKGWALPHGEPAESDWIIRPMPCTVDDARQRCEDIGLPVYSLGDCNHWDVWLPEGTNTKWFSQFLAGYSSQQMVDR